MQSENGNGARLRQVVADVFGMPANLVSDETSPDTVESWDSLTHIDLVVALESEFGIVLSPEDTMEMLSVGLIRTILTERGVSFA